tara:strand:+ start:40514 stop:41056 length:543 start_codon:yes stop_codon:yes gene_type:complete
MGYQEVFESNALLRKIYGTSLTGYSTEMMMLDYVLGKLVDTEDMNKAKLLRAKFNLVGEPDTSGTVTTYTVYYGMSADDSLSNGGDLSSLNSVINSAINAEVPIIGTSEYIYFATPVSLGSILKLQDGNDFTVYNRNATSGPFQLTQATVVVGGVSILYNIYRTHIPTQVQPQQNYDIIF